MLVHFGVAKLAEFLINKSSGDTSRRDNAKNSQVAHGAALGATWGLALTSDLHHAITAPTATVVHANEIASERADQIEAEKPQANYYEMGLDQSVDASEEAGVITLDGDVPVDGEEA
jgi:hypothetical protein